MLQLPLDGFVQALRWPERDLATDAVDDMRALSNIRLLPSTELPAMDLESYSTK